MNVTLSKNSGFCPGVKKAHIFVEKLLSDSEFDKIFTLGELIHNRIYNENLKKKGVDSISVEELKETLSSSNKKIALIVRTHGIKREEAEALKRLESTNPNFKVFDLTCHHVKAAQKIAAENTSDSTAFLLYSDPNHPEAIATMSYANGEKYAFSSLSELKKIKTNGK